MPKKRGSTVKLGKGEEKTVLERIGEDAEALSQLGGAKLPGEDFGAEDDPFTDAPENVVYDVYRVDDRSKKPVYQFRLERADVEAGLHQVIQEKRGGGTYDVREKYPDPDTGRPKWGRSRRIFVDGPPKALVVPVRPEVGTLNAQGQPQPHPAEPGTMDDLLQQRIVKMVEMQDAMTAGIIERFKKGNDEGGGKMVELLLPMLTPLLTSLVERLLMPPTVPSVPVAPPTPMSELLATMRELQEFQSSLGGGGGRSDDGDDSPGNLIREFAPILRDVFAQARRADERRVAAPRPALPSTTGGVPVLTLLGTQVPKLVSLAKDGKSATLYGQVVADQLPKQYRDVIKNFLSRPTEVWGREWFEKFPMTVPHAKWFVDFGSALRDALGGHPVVADSNLPLDGSMDPSKHEGEVEVEPEVGGVL